MSHVVAADHDDEVAIASGASWELAPTPRVGPARKTSCRTCLWSLIALDGLPERASEAKIAFAQLFSLLNFRVREWARSLVGTVRGGGRYGHVASSPRESRTSPCQPRSRHRPGCAMWTVSLASFGRG